jgi:hypothetical protein
VKHAKEYLETMESLVPLIRKARRYSLWQFDILCDWFAYFWNRGTITFVIDARGNAQGVCAIKLFSRLEQFLEPFVHEPSGKFCMVDLLVAVSPPTIADCFEILFKRWGQQAIMIWDRGDRTDQPNRAPRMYTWGQYLKLTNRLTYGIVKEEPNLCRAVMQHNQK